VSKTARRRRCAPRDRRYRSSGGKRTSASTDRVPESMRISRLRRLRPRRGGSEAKAGATWKSASHATRVPLIRSIAVRSSRMVSAPPMFAVRAHDFLGDSGLQDRGDQLAGVARHEQRHGPDEERQAGNDKEHATIDSAAARKVA